jgi:uncharacterized membrane protein
MPSRPTTTEEIASYNQRVKPFLKAVWWTGLLLCVGVGVAIGYAWSFVVGISIMCVLALVWLPVFLRLHKALQVRRFPELADEHARWRRTTYFD